VKFPVFENTKTQSNFFSEFIIDSTKYLIITLLPLPQNPAIVIENGKFKNLFICIFNVFKKVMDIFSANRINFSDGFCNSILNGSINSAYFQNLTDSGKRNYRHLLTFLEIENGKIFIEIKSKTANLRKHRVEIISPGRANQVLLNLYDSAETTKNGRDSFYNKVINRYCGISRRYVQEWLEKQENYQFHLIQPREKVLRPIGDKKINSRAQIDLIDMQKFKSPQNHNRGFLFVYIDVFSKYVYVRAITEKTALKNEEALKDILATNYVKTGEYPRLIQSDNGKEFVNKKPTILLQNFSHNPGVFPICCNLVFK